MKKMVLRTVLWVAILGVFAVLAPNPALSQPKGPKGKRPGDSYARRVLRHKEHQLLREARRHQREAAREKRQAAGLKRTLKRHKKK
jgi:hypothetical protein